MRLCHAGTMVYLSSGAHLGTELFVEVCGLQTDGWCRLGSRPVVVSTALAAAPFDGSPGVVECETPLQEERDFKGISQPPSREAVSEHHMRYSTVFAWCDFRMGPSSWRRHQPAPHWDPRQLASMGSFCSWTMVLAH